MVPWVVALAAFFIAVIALIQARQTAQKLSHLTEMYWQLKYDHGELKAKVDPAAPSPPAPRETFVPLSSVKKS